MENLIGRVIENYKFEKVLGQGGMGIVYRAYDMKLDRHVAIKLLSVQVVDLSRFIERFRREAKNQAKLVHPNIVTVYGFIEAENLLGIVMEYVEGDSIDKIIHKQGRLHPYDAVYLIKQVLSGIGYAHIKGFIHRDIKPSNIIVNREGVVKIMDFGISKSLFEKGVTKTGAKVGTVYYMSPEQIRGEKITHHADIYSIGCTLYEMLSGSPPFFYDSEYEIMDAHLKKAPPKLSKIIPGMLPQLDELISRSMAKSPAERFQHCEEFLQEINKVESMLTKMHSQYAGRQSKRKMGRVASILAFSGFILVFLALSYFVYNQVDELFKSKQLDMLKKYSIETLFEGEDHYKGFNILRKYTLQNKFQVNSIFMGSVDNGVAVGDSGLVALTFDNGLNWIEKRLPDSTLSLRDVYINGSGNYFAVGDSGKILFSHDNFKTYRTSKIQGNYTLSAINFLDESIGFIVGSNGLVLKTVDGGRNWKRVPIKTSSFLYDIEFVDKMNGYIVDKDGLVHRTINQGESWDDFQDLAERFLKAIDFTNEYVGLAIGSGGNIFRTDDGGKTWKVYTVKNVRGLSDVNFVTEDLAVITAGKGLLLISEDSGYTWKLFDTHTYVNFTHLATNAKGHLFISGVNGTILRIK